MDYKDYYTTLGVSRTASAAEIKKAFRKLAREHHPDLKPGDTAAEARFKDVNEAYEVLGDPEKRKRYDTLGADWERYANAAAGGSYAGGPFAGGFPGGGPFGGGGAGAGPGGVRYEFHTGGDPNGFSDFFRVFFGGGMDGGAAPGAGAGPRGGQAGQGRGSLDDLFAGLGGRAGRGGRGRSGDGGARGAAAPIEATAEVSLDEAFHGTTRLVEIDGKRLEVTVPRGVDDGSRIRLRGKGGDSGQGARDLILVVRAQPHAVFSRKGADLSRELTIELRDALLGGEVRVPTLSGAVLLRIPAGTQSGRTFRLTGQGMPRLNADGRGDLLVKVHVRIPTLRDDAERRAAETFLDALGSHGAAV